MILEKQKENLELTDGEIHESYATVIDFDSADFLKQMLSKFYSDAVGSLIRETASNALDSHREIDSSEPIIVSLAVNREGNWEYSVEDFGVGINKDTINNILRKYGKSTKRNSNNQLGAYGLGWKSPLAYSSSFYFIGRKDGIEIKCMMYEGEEDIKIDILSEQPTSERNGCKVIVPVKTNDKREFSNKITSQLAYFENVFFNVDYLDNNFKIHREEHFQISEIVTDQYMHICLDNVYYPIDYLKLGIHSIPVSLGLRFSLTDGLFPVPNRESIKYTTEAKEIILNKIKEVADWCINKYDESSYETDDIFKVFNHYDSTIRKLNIGDITKEIQTLIPYSTAKSIQNPTIKGLKQITTDEVVGVKKFLLKEFQKEYYLINGRVSLEKHWKEVNINDFMNKASNIYTFSERLSPIKKEYIKHLEKSNSSSRSYQKVWFIKKRPSFSLWENSVSSLTQIVLKDYKSFYKILSLNKVDRALWRSAIEDFFYVRDLIVNPNIIDIDSLVIPTEFIEARKNVKVAQKKIKLSKELGDVSAKQCVPLRNYSSTKFSKLEPVILKLDTLHKKANLIIYGSTEDADRLDKLFSISRGKVSFVVFSDRELKKVNQAKIHNLMSLEEFLKGDNKVFKRMITSQLIYNFKTSYNNLFNKLEKFTNVSQSFVDKITRLENYRNEWFHKGDYSIKEELIKFATENNKFDNSVYSEFLQMEKTCEKLYFINTLATSTFQNYGSVRKSSPEVKLTVDLFKYHKERVNLEHYSCTPIVTEEVF